MTTKADDKAHRTLPDPRTIIEAGQLPITDEHGKEHPFNTLYTNQSEDERNLVIFIRNFFCGYCEHYLRTLLPSLTPHLPPNTSLTIIGCGSHILIPDYKARNNITCPIYADPSLKLYKTLGFGTSSQPLLDGWKNRVSPYHSQNFVTSTLGSIWDGLMLGPKKALSAGPAGQNGGAVLFEGGECVFVHRMRDVGDYFEPEEARRLLGIEGEGIAAKES